MQLSALRVLKVCKHKFLLVLVFLFHTFFFQKEVTGQCLCVPESKCSADFAGLTNLVCQNESVPCCKNNVVPQCGVSRPKPVPGFIYGANDTVRLFYHYSARCKRA